VNGNAALQAVITFTPQGTDGYNVVYSGDSNYPGANGYIYSSVVVTGNDFGMTPAQASVTATAGQQVVANFFVLAQSNTAPINFACSGLPSATTCITGVSGLIESGEVAFTIATTAPSAAVRIAHFPHSTWWKTAFGVTLAGLFMFGASASNRRRSAMWFGLMMLALLMTVPSCGGGSSGGGGGGGGGGGNGGTPTGTYPLTITATSGSGSAAITHTATFNLIVQ
jgi:hypothetical protein